jgi:hypothetical protein
MFAVYVSAVFRRVREIATATIGFDMSFFFFFFFSSVAIPLGYIIQLVNKLRRTQLIHIFR